MAFLYLDDSKHHRFGFSIAAFVICDSDPTEHITSVFHKLGYNPEVFEYKSSLKMAKDESLRALRSALKSFIGGSCKIAVCVVDRDKRLGPAALELLIAALSHSHLKGQSHEVFFDEGLFQSSKPSLQLVKDEPKFRLCKFHFEQDSRKHLGIQLADLVAHTCSMILLETLGHAAKKLVLKMPGDSVYDGLEVELGFELWAGIRYTFLSNNKPNPKDDFDLSNVEVYPWGLFIDEGVDDRIYDAAMKRFGKNYLGCIH
ncbi:MAG: DUF3800 domain-containing protein [Pseudomonadota bacterium]